MPRTRNPALESDPEIEILPALDDADEPTADEQAPDAVDEAAKERGWIQSLLSRLSRGQKR